MRFLLSILLYFNVINAPYVRKKNSDLLSLSTISKIFNLNTNFTDTTIDIADRNDTIHIDIKNLTYYGKINGNLQYLKITEKQALLDAENAIYIASVLKGTYLYWDSDKHRIIESAYPPSIKAFEIKDNTIRLVHNIDLEPRVKKIQKELLIEVQYGFYHGPPFIYFDDVQNPVQNIKITYSSRGTIFKIHLRKDISFDSTSSTGVFTLKLMPSPLTNRKTLEDTKSKTTVTSKKINKERKKRYKKINVIVIDPGHGGKDPGAVSRNGTREKDIVFALAKRVAKKLKKRGFKVILTRDRDKFITLRERTKIANSSKCDLFISIHANYSKGKRAHGVETYFLSEARTKWERSVAAFENSVIKYELENTTKEQDILKWILGDMAQNEFLRESQDLAAFIQESLTKKTGSLDRGVRQAGFYVLYGIYAPSVLIEVGFITNPKEEKILRSRKYQEKIADGIVEGILKYKKYHERKYGKS